MGVLSHTEQRKLLIGYVHLSRVIHDVDSFLASGQPTGNIWGRGPHIAAFLEKPICPDTNSRLNWLRKLKQADQSHNLLSRFGSDLQPHRMFTHCATVSGQPRSR